MMSKPLLSQKMTAHLWGGCRSRRSRHSSKSSNNHGRSKHNTREGDDAAFLMFKTLHISLLKIPENTILYGCVALMLLDVQHYTDNYLP